MEEHQSLSPLLSKVPPSSRICSDFLETGHPRWFLLIDMFASILLIFPLTVGFWWGLWDIQIFYFITYRINLWIPLGISSFLQFLLAYSQGFLIARIHPKIISFYVITRTLLMFEAIITVTIWSTFSTILDNWFDRQFLPALIMFVITLIFGVWLNLLETFGGSPLSIQTDDSQAFHATELRFNSTPDYPVQYFLDCFFSTVICQLVACISWWGIWILLDQSFYPQDQLISMSASLGLGVSVMTLHYMVRIISYGSLEKLKADNPSTAVILEIVEFVGCVLVWRGAWGLCDIYLLSETRLTNQWITFLIGAIGATFLGCISTLFGRGAVKSEEETLKLWSRTYVSCVKDIL